MGMGAWAAGLVVQSQPASQLAPTTITTISISHRPAAKNQQSVLACRLTFSDLAAGLGLQARHHAGKLQADGDGKRPWIHFSVSAGRRAGRGEAIGTDAQAAKTHKTGKDDGWVPNGATGRKAGGDEPSVQNRTRAARTKRCLGLPIVRLLHPAPLSTSTTTTMCGASCCVLVGVRVAVGGCAWRKKRILASVASPADHARHGWPLRRWPSSRRRAPPEPAAVTHAPAAPALAPHRTACRSALRQRHLPQQRLAAPDPREPSNAQRARCERRTRVCVCVCGCGCVGGCGGAEGRPRAEIELKLASARSRWAGLLGWCSMHQRDFD